jgi:Rrf2 family protein
MRLSKTSEYALRVLSYMINSDMQVFSAKHLVETLDVPDKYLRRLMTDMSKKGFIKSLQGREGGYVFAKNASKIYLSDVVEAVEGMEKYSGCIMGFHRCSDDNPCSLHKTYGPVRDHLVEFLSTTTISALKDHTVLKF